MGLLHGFRQNGQILCAPVFALKINRFLSPRQLDKLDGLGDAVAALLAQHLRGIAQRDSGRRPPASAEAQVESTIGQYVACRGLSCHVEGMMQRSLSRQCAESDAFGFLSGGNRHHQRVGHGSRRVEHRLRQPRRLKTQFFSKHDLFNRLPVTSGHRRTFISGRLRKYAKSHRPLLLGPSVSLIVLHYGVSCTKRNPRFAAHADCVASRLTSASNNK